MADANTPDWVTPGLDQGKEGGLGSMVASGIHQAGAGLGMLGAAAGMNTTGWAQSQAHTAQNYQQQAAAGGIPQSWSQVEGPVDALKFIGGQAAQMAPTLAVQGAGALAGGALAGPAGAAAGFLAPTMVNQTGENLQEQYVESGGKTQDPFTAAALAVPESALQMVGPEGRAARFTLGAVDRTGSRLANAALTAGREGVVNAGIGGVTAAISEANKASVSQQPTDLLSSAQNVLEGAATGAVMGGIIGGVRGVLHMPTPRTPNDAGGDSSRDADYGSPSAGANPAVSTTLSTPTDKVPAYVRQGAVIPWINDQGGDDVGAAMTGQSPGGPQGTLDLQGAGPYSPRFDRKGNPLPGQSTPNPEAQAAQVGAGPYTTQDQAVQGLQQLHADLNTQLAQALSQGDSGTVAQLTQHIKDVEGHLNVLDAQPAAGQRNLDFSPPATRNGTPAAQVLFQDKDATTQLDAAQKIAESSQPPAQPNPNAQIITPPSTAVPPRPVARPGEAPTALQAANARFPAPAEPSRIAQPEGAQAKPGFQLQGNPTPQFDQATPQAGRPAFDLEHPEAPRQASLPLEEPTGQTPTGTAGQQARPSDTKTGDMFAENQPSATQWQTRMRMGWKGASDGSLQGFHKALKTALEAKTPEDAAAAVRTKAGDDTSSTAYHKLDAVHRALTGETIEQGRISEARESATQQVEGASESGERGTEVARTDGVPEGQAEETRTEPVQPPTEHAEVQADQAAGVQEGESGVAGQRQPSAREQNVQRLIQTLDTTKDPKEFQRAVNDLYAEAQTYPERSGDMAAHQADLYLQNPEHGVTDENLAAAAKSYNEAGLTKRTEFKESDANKRRSDSITNPDIGNRTMLPENMRAPGTVHNGTALATHLAQNAKSQVVRMAMRTALNSGRNLDDVNVHIVHDGEHVPEYVAHEMHDGAEAFTTTGKTPEVWMHGSAADEETAAHELLHAALPDAMNRSNDGGMTQIMQDVKRAMQERGMLDTPEGQFFNRVALANPNEFTSYGFSSPTFRRMLDALDTPEKRSLWDRFKAAVAAIFKSPKAMLDKLLDRPSDAAHTPIAARMEEALGRMLSPDNPRVMQERAEVYRSTATTPSGTLDMLKEGEKDIWDSLRNMARAGKRFWVGSMPTHALSDQFSYRMPALKDVVRSLDDRTNSQHVLARKAAAVNDQIKEAYRAAGKSLDRYNSVMEDSQIATLDPRTADLNRAQADLARAKDSYDQVMRKADATDMEKASARGMMRRAVAAARLADSWKKMTEPEKKAVGMTFDALRDSINERQQVLNDMLLKNRDGFHDETLDKMREDGASQDEIDAQITRTYGNVLKVAAEPYAPLRRYGDWATVASSPEYRAAEAAARDARVKYSGEVAAGKLGDTTESDMRSAENYLNVLKQDPEHRIVQFHNSSVDASNEADRLRAAYPKMEVQRFQRNEYMNRAAGNAGGMINKIIEAVGERLPQELRDNIANSIREVYVDSLPDNSFEHSMQGREGVAGYSQDFSRASLDTLLRDSFNISSLKHGEQMGAALSEMDKQRKASDDDTLNAIHREVSKRLQQSTDHQVFRQWEQRIAQVTHLMYLGASPGFLLMNMMQMPMITAPMIMARYGTHGAGEITRGVADIFKMMDKRGQLDVQGATHLTAQERDMLTTLENQGILNMTALHDATTNAHASNIIDPQTTGESIGKAYQITKDIANLPAQYVETVNRAASALAAYRLAREGRSKYGAQEHGAATDYAAKIVRDSHVDYSASNNPAMLRAPGGRLLFQFKKYWLNMLHMVSNNMYDSFGHRSEIKALRNQLADDGLADDVRAQKQEMLNQLQERRDVARRTLAGLYGMHLIHTGAMGMPFAGGGIALANIMRNWYNDPEDHADTAVDLQNWLTGVMGVQGSDTLMHGIWAGLIGAGISERIGMGDLANPIRLNQQKTGTGTVEGTVDNVLLGAMGPTAGLTMQIAQGFDQMAKGNYAKGAAKFLPKAAGDIIKGINEGENGGLVDNKGKMVTQLNTKDALLQALGITPEKVLQAYDAKNATAEAKTTFNDARKAVVDNYAQALKAGGDTTQAKAQMDAFNERNPDQKLRVTVGEVMRARQALDAQPKPPTAKAKALEARTDKSAFTKDED